MLPASYRFRGRRLFGTHGSLARAVKVHYKSNPHRGKSLPPLFVGNRMLEFFLGNGATSESTEPLLTQIHKQKTANQPEIPLFKPKSRAQIGERLPPPPKAKLEN